MSNFGSPIADVQFGDGVRMSDSTEYPLPGTRPGDFTTDVILAGLIGLVHVAPNSDERQQEHAKKVDKSTCGCTKHCFYWRVKGAELTMKGGTRRETAALERALSAAMRETLRSDPGSHRGAKGGTGRCGPRTGENCTTSCPKIVTAHVYRIPISGRVRLGSGAVATFSGVLLIVFTYVTHLWEGTRTDHPYVDSEPLPPPKQPRKRGQVTGPVVWGTLLEDEEVLSTDPMAMSLASLSSGKGACRGCSTHPRPHPYP